MILSDLHVIRGRFWSTASPSCQSRPRMRRCRADNRTGDTGPVSRAPVSCWSMSPVPGANCWYARPSRNCGRADAVSDEDAAQALVSPVTAWVLTMIRHRMQRGEWLTQTAASSTVGRLILQLARGRLSYHQHRVSARAGSGIRQLGGDVTFARRTIADVTARGGNWYWTGQGDRLRREQSRRRAGAGIGPGRQDTGITERSRRIARPSDRHSRCRSSGPA